MRPSLSRLPTTAALCLALGASVVSVGCSSTPTRESAGQVVDDSVITSRVKTRFVEDKDVSALGIHVETYKGTVQLSGFANSPAEMMRAAEVAASVPGVKAVRNDIRLKSQ